MPERYFVGVDGGTESLRAAVFDARGTVLGSATTAYKTTFPKPSWAEQNPEDWWQALGSSVNAAVSSSRIQPSEIAAICLDTTCCSVVALDATGRHVRPALIWMDIRASQEAMRISSCGDEALRLNGYGSVSAEWMAAKALWLLENEPANFERAKFVCEYQDYLNHRLTGRMTGSLNNVSIRWHYDAARGGFQKFLIEVILVLADKLGTLEICGFVLEQP